MQKTPENFVVKYDAALAIGVSPRDIEFAKIWEDIANRAVVVHSDKRLWPITITKKSASFEVRSDNTMVKENVEKGGRKNDVYLAKSSLSALEELYYAYAPHTSQQPRKSEIRVKAQSVRTKVRRGERSYFFSPILKKNDSFLQAKEIAEYFGVEESVINIRLMDIKAQFEDYWLLENQYQSNKTKHMPSPIIVSECNARAVNRNEVKHAGLKVNDDITLMRYEDGNGY